MVTVVDSLTVAAVLDGLTVVDGLTVAAVLHDLTMVAVVDGLTVAAVLGDLTVVAVVDGLTVAAVVDGLTVTGVLDGLNAQCLLFTSGDIIMQETIVTGFWKPTKMSHFPKSTFLHKIALNNDTDNWAKFHGATINHCQDIRSNVFNTLITYFERISFYHTAEIAVLFRKPLMNTNRVQITY